MKRLGAIRIGRKSTILPLLCAITLAGCEGELSTISPEIQANTETTVETVIVDVAAPEAFSITDNALWDGRPTFGGVWIAYPEIEEPERVRIRNESNGKEVIGALYRREREFPGPKIELSADAAAALAVLAGVPTELTIVALRRKTVEVEVETPVVEEAIGGMTTPLRRPTAEEVVAEPTSKPTIEAPISRSTPEVAVETPEIEESVLPPAENFVPNTEAVNIYIQVATWQSKERAEEVAAKLSTAGLNVEIRERETETKTLYRIIVGPANSKEAAEIMMSVVVELGYKDAIVLG